MNAPDMNPTEEPGARSDAAVWSRFAGVSGDEVEAKPGRKAKPAPDRADRFAVHLEPVIPPDRRRSAALMQDRWRIGHERLQLKPGGIPWKAEMPSRHFADRLHRFDWLGGLFAEGEAGADRARMLVDHWIAEFGRFHPFHWRMSPAVARVWNWMLAGAALFDTGEALERRARIEALGRQLRHVEAGLEACVDPVARWRGACVLVAAAVTLDEGRDLEAALARLEQECTAQVLPDGGLVSRSPQRVLDALADLLVLRSALHRSGQSLPDSIDKWMSRMGAMVQFFRLGDGALAPFNDGGESRAEVVDAVLRGLGEPPRSFTFAMKSGFQKLRKQELNLILDAGTAPPRPYAGAAHAGVLGFELSDGPARIVTSCGFSPEVSLEWQAAVRGSAAHSTLTLAGRDAARLEPFEATRLLTPIGPDGVAAKRLEEAEEIWLDAQHSGWKERFGLIHRRRLFMSGDGTRLTGEDALVRPVSRPLDDEGKFVGFDIRFHLHPTVSASLAGDAIRLECENGAVWRFRTTHPGTRLEASRYLARGVVETTQQIVMSGRADPNGDGAEPPNCVRWVFKRETKGQ